MKKMVKIGGIVVIFCVVLFLSGCLAPKTDRVMHSMMKSFAKADSYAVDLSLGVNGQFPQIADIQSETAKLVPGSILLKLKGDVDTGRDFQYALNGNLKYKLDKTVLDFVGDVLFADTNFYLKLSEAPDLGSIDLTQLENNWYEFDTSIMGEENSGKLSKIDESKNKKIKKIMAKTKFFEVTEDLGDEDWEGRPAFHYAIRVDGMGLGNFLEKSTEIMEDRDFTEEEQEELNEVLKQWSGFTGQIWIDKDNYNLYRFEMGAQVLDEEKGMVRYDLAVTFSEHDEDVDISKPENSSELNLLDVLTPKVSEDEVDETKLEELKDALEKYE